MNHRSTNRHNGLISIQDCRSTSWRLLETFQSSNLIVVAQYNPPSSSHSFILFKFHHSGCSHRHTYVYINTQVNTGKWDLLNGFLHWFALVWVFICLLLASSLLTARILRRLISRIKEAGDRWKYLSTVQVIWLDRSTWGYHTFNILPLSLSLIWYLNVLMN